MDNFNLHGYYKPTASTSLNCGYPVDNDVKLSSMDRRARIWGFRGVAQW